MGEFVAECHSVDGECAAYRHQSPPIEFFGMLVKVVGVAGLEFMYRFENAQRRAATQVRLIKHFQVAFK